MTYGEIQQYQKDRKFQTSDGEIDAEMIKNVDSLRIDFKCAPPLTLLRVDVDDLERALTAVIDHYAAFRDTVRKYKEEMK